MSAAIRGAESCGGGSHRAAGFPRGSLSARLRLRMTPKLYFVDEARRRRDPHESRGEGSLAPEPGAHQGECKARREPGEGSLAPAPGAAKP